MKVTATATKTTATVTSVTITINETEQFYLIAALEQWHESTQDELRDCFGEFDYEVIADSTAELCLVGQLITTLRDTSS